MEEADRIATRIAIMDHGKIVATGTPSELKQQTNTTTLDDAFLELTGKAIREEGADFTSHMRTIQRMRRR
jgi:ABC-2 type transport system ATP-binding protein